MRRIYLSPHLDDAVLSCGGAIHRQAAAGEPVLVVTIFAGEYTGAGLSAFAQEQHDYWGNPPRPLALRRAEDWAALRRLGAEAQHLDHLDAVYRAGSDGRWLYTDVDQLFGAVHPADLDSAEGSRALAKQLAGLVPLQPQATIYAPLGVGNHVDHQIVHAAARRLLAMGHRLAFYEEAPYVASPGALEAALETAGAGGWSSQVIPLSPADLAAKVSALAYYRTQLAVLFGGAEAMPSRIWTLAATCSPNATLAERIWWPPLPPHPSSTAPGEAAGERGHHA